MLGWLLNIKRETHRGIRNHKSGQEYVLRWTLGGGGGRVKFEKIPASFQAGCRIKAENRARKIALLASMTAEDKARFNRDNADWFEKIAADFGGYTSKR